MPRTSGVQITRAMHVLQQLGWTTAKLAAELGVHPRTTVRWARGVHTPSRRNLLALRGLVAQLGLAETAAPRLTRAARLLEVAHDALLTDAERARDEELARDIRAHLVAQRQAALRSITTQVDPFDLVTRSRPEPALVGAGL